MSILDVLSSVFAPQMKSMLSQQTAQNQLQGQENVQPTQAPIQPNMPQQLAQYQPKQPFNPNGDDLGSALMRLSAASGGANEYRKYMTGEGLGGNGIPSAIQEYQYYTGLPKEQRDEYLRVKRQDPWRDAGGQLINPITGQTIAKTLAPQDLPQTREQQAAASAKGTATGGAIGAQEAKGIKAPATLEVIDEAKKLLPKASSGRIGAIGAGLKAAANVSDEATQADKQLSVLSANLVANVPRMEGPQSDKDVNMYKEAAGDIGNISKPYEDRLAALKIIESLNKKYAGIKESSPNIAPQVRYNAKGQKATLVNGKWVIE